MTDILETLNTALSDRYRIERELGAGGMATVYLAEDLKHERKVALKVLKPELAAVLSVCRLAVTNDSGGMHLAAAVGTPVVAVFGGTDPLKHAPHRKPFEVLCASGEAQTWTPIDVGGAKERLRAIDAETAYDACVRMAFPSGT